MRTLNDKAERMLKALDGNLPNSTRTNKENVSMTVWNDVEN